jgi:glycosyltransferase involved in cell wall biosynthesis
MYKISVFTPSHNTKWLDECYESLKKQTYGEWEWIVLLNGGADWTPPADERIKLYKTDTTDGIGALKSEACSFATGSILVELDHDDLLVSNCLLELHDVFKMKPEVGFVYSNTAQISEDGSRNDTLFNGAMGWTYEEIEIDGQTLLQCNSMEPFPSSVSYVWYAPNHVRAFRKSVYDQIGGYNPTLEVLDDLDIICRMYQASEFHHIESTLYLQRVHPENSQVKPELNGRIQIETVELYDQHVQANAIAWANRNNLRLLDLGGAYNSPTGYESVDLHDNADLVGDVFDVLGNIEDNTVGVIRAVDFMEHIPDKIKLMNECYRVLTHGGMLLTLTPSSDGRGAFQDPTHVAYWNENSFWYFTNEQYAKFVPEITCKFQTSRITTNYPSKWHEQNDISYVNANLVAIKNGPRIAGEYNWPENNVEELEIQCNCKDCRITQMERWTQDCDHEIETDSMGHISCLICRKSFHDKTIHEG